MDTEANMTIIVSRPYSITAHHMHPNGCKSTYPIGWFPSDELCIREVQKIANREPNFWFGILSRGQDRIATIFPHKA